MVSYLVGLFVICNLAAAVIIYSLIRWRTKQLHEKHRELEKTVADRTKQLSHRVEELAVINSVQDGLVRKMDMQGIYDLVGEKIREIFNAQVIDIVTYDKTTSLIEDRYTYEKGDRTLLGPRPLKGFRKHVIETVKPLVINKDVDQQRTKYDQSVIIGEGAKSIVLVPMIAGGEVTGVISLQNLDKENAFSDSDVNLLTTLANSMSVALESAKRFDETKRLLKETEQRTAELGVINSVQEGLAKELDMNGIFNLIGDRVQNLFNAQAVIHPAPRAFIAGMTACEQQSAIALTRMQPELGWSDLFDRLEYAGPRIEEQHVHGAEFRGDLLKHTGDRGRIADVASMSDGAFDFSC